MVPSLDPHPPRLGRSPAEHEGRLGNLECQGVGVKDAIKVIEEIRDNYIRENCQTFNDGHWVGTARQQEYVSELDDLMEVLKLRAALQPRRAT